MNVSPRWAKIAQYPTPARVVIFLLVLVCIWLPVAAPIYLLLDDANLVTILTMGLLFATFLIFIQFWGKWVHRHPHLLQHYGLEKSRRNGIELLRGLSFGLLTTLSLFILQGLLGWFIWQQSPEFLLIIILQGLVSALGIALAEELVFRGWLLDELQRDYNLKTALFANAGIFALLHYLKPIDVIIRSLPAFLGLFLLGLSLVWAKRSSQGRLGLSIGLHAGLVWGYYIIDVGKLGYSAKRVPEWITGIYGNPLAGLLGVLFLSAIAWGLWRKAKKVTSDE